MPTSVAAIPAVSMRDQRWIRARVSGVRAAAIHSAVCALGRNRVCTTVFLRILIARSSRPDGAPSRASAGRLFLAGPSSPWGVHPRGPSGR